MKIICTDNYDREHIADILIAENVHKYYAKFIADSLNAKYGGEHSSDFFCVVEDDRKLWGGMEELV